MNFLKRMSGKKTKTEGPRKAPRNTPSSLSEIVMQGIDNNNFDDMDVARRKAEFLELLAKEERAHRVKLAEMRNEPLSDLRQGSRSESPSGETESAARAEKSARAAEIERPAAPIDSPIRAQKPPRLEPEAPSVPSERETAKIARPTENETRAAIGRQLGGTDFLLAGKTSFETPAFEAEVPETVKAADVSSETKPADVRDREQGRVPLPPMAQEPKSAPLAPAKSRSDAPEIPNVDFSSSYTSGRANVGELRLDVARITSDIENGDALYRRAQQRVQGLMHFVERAEVDFSVLERIEPENRRLKARTATLEKEVEEQTRKSALMEADLDEHRRRLAEVNVQYDTVNGNLAKAMRALAERDREIRQYTNDISAITLKLDREKTTTEVEIRENNVLRERVVNLTNELEDTKAARGETGKLVEGLKIDLEDHRVARERLETETYDLRHALDTAQKQNTQMKGEMVALHQDISTFKTQYEFNIISRDDRITMLEGQIEDLARKLQVKEDIVSSAARDVTDLRKNRTAGELERERLEKQIDAQTRQLEEAHRQLLESQHKVEEMDDRYRDVAAALSIAQNRRQIQPPSSAPDIQPAPARPEAPIRQEAPPNPRQHDDLDGLSQESIEDRIMDYKLGLRKNIF